MKNDCYSYQMGNYISNMPYQRVEGVKWPFEGHEEAAGVLVVVIVGSPILVRLTSLLKTAGII